MKTAETKAERAVRVATHDLVASAVHDPYDCNSIVDCVSRLRRARRALADARATGERRPQAHRLRVRAARGARPAQGCAAGGVGRMVGHLSKRAPMVDQGRHILDVERLRALLGDGT